MSKASKQSLRNFIRNSINKFGTRNDLHGMLAMLALTKFREPEAIRNLEPEDTTGLHRLATQVRNTYYQEYLAALARVDERAKEEAEKSKEEAEKEKLDQEKLDQEKLNKENNTAEVGNFDADSKDVSQADAAVTAGNEDKENKENKENKVDKDKADEDTDAATEKVTTVYKYDPRKDPFEVILYNVTTCTFKMDVESYSEFLKLIRWCNAIEILEVALESDDNHPDGTYNTPAWLNRMMAKLGQIETNQSILDPTMGLGGSLLAAYHQSETSMAFVGQDKVYVSGTNAEQMVDGFRKKMADKKMAEEDTKGKKFECFVYEGEQSMAESLAEAGQTPVVFKYHGRLIGQDENRQVLGMGFVNLIMHGVKLEDIRLFSGDMFSRPNYLEAEEKFDRVIQMPPSGMWGDLDKIKATDDRFLYGLINKTATDWMTITSSIAVLKPEGGISVVAVNGGALYKGGASGKMRETIVNYDWIDTVISLPSTILKTSIPWAIVVCNNHKDDKMKGKIHFINVGEDCFDGSNRFTQGISEKGLKKVLTVYESREDVEGFSKVVAIEDIKDGILLPTDYIETKDYTIDGMTVEVDQEAFDKVDTIRLDRIVDIGRGFNMTSRNEDKHGAYRVIRITDITDDGHINFDELIRTNPVGGKVENYDLKGGDLILTIRGSMHKVGLIPEDLDKVIYNANLVRLRVKTNQYVPTWIRLYLSSVLGQWLLSRMSRGTTVKQISIADLKALPVPKVSFDRQIKDILAYERAREEINDMKRKIDEKEVDLKRNMIECFGFQEAFTIR